MQGVLVKFVLFFRYTVFDCAHINSKMKAINTAFLIVSSIVGAGFASGRELVSFFGISLGLWLVPVVGAFVFATSLLFLRVGAKLHSAKARSNNREIFGKFGVVADCFALLNSFVVLAAMLAGITAISGTTNSLPLVAILLGLLAVIVQKFGIKGLVRANSVLVPLLIIILFAVSFVAIDKFALNLNFLAIVLPKSVLYVSLNMYLASGALYNLELNFRQSFVASLLSGLLIGGLLLALVLAISANPSATSQPMPLLYIVKQFGLLPQVLVSITLIACIFGSMLIALYNIVEWLSSLVSDRILAGLMATSCAFVLSMIGFEQIVRWIYPIVAVVGIVYLFFNILYLAKKIDTPYDEPFDEHEFKLCN